VMNPFCLVLHWYFSKNIEFSRLDLSSLTHLLSQKAIDSHGLVLPWGWLNRTLQYCWIKKECFSVCFCTALWDISWCQKGFINKYDLTLMLMMDDRAFPYYTVCNTDWQEIAEMTEIFCFWNQKVMYLYVSSGQQGSYVRGQRAD
jgi:hypothetical protein